jgi:hypothetical protein
MSSESIRRLRRSPLRRALLGVLAGPLLLTGFAAHAKGTLAADDPSWRLQSSADGINLYRSSIRGSGVVPLKATMTIPGTIEEVSLVLQDISRRSEWVGNRTESVLLERPSDYDQTEYLRVDLPWPVSDRSAVIRAHITVSDDRGRATITAESVESCPADTLPRLVRAQVHPSTFQMTQAPGRVEIVALVFVDPAGWIPKWIVNYFAGRVARATFVGLRRQVARNLYSAAQRRAMRERILAYGRAPTVTN